MDAGPPKRNSAEPRGGVFFSPLVHRFFSRPDGKIRVVFRLLLFLICALWLRALCVWIARPRLYAPFPYRLFFFYALLCSGLVLLSWAFFRVIDERSFRVFGLWLYPGWGRELARGVALGLALQLVILALLLASRAANIRGVGEGGARALAGVLYAAVLMVLIAAAEEIAFRGYMFQGLLNSAGPLIAILIFSVLFGVVHLWNPAASPLSTANTVLAGILLSLSYVKTRALWMPIGLHWAWNFTMGSILSLPVSGLSLGPSLVQVEMVRGEWFTGGRYGPEGGVVVTVVSLAAILWLWRTPRVAPSPAMQEALQ